MLLIREIQMKILLTFFTSKINRHSKKMRKHSVSQIKGQQNRYFHTLVVGGQLV